MKRALPFLILSVFFVLPASLPAQEDKGGWSGSLTLGIGGQYGRSSQLEYDDDYEKIKSLNEKRDRESRLLPAVLFDINYTFKNTGTTLFALYQVDDSGIGVAQSLGDYGDLSFAIDYKREKVWENPYQVGRKRDDTVVDLPSFAIGWENILGSGFILEYMGQGVDVDDDRIGDKETDLERDGKIHALEAGYFILIDESNILIPNLTYKKGDMDGESNSYEGYVAGLAYEFTQEDLFSIELSFSGGKNEYDKSHPIFNETREDKIYSLGAVFTYLNPFGFEDFFVSVMGGYERVDSNINFFDSHSTIIGVGAGYQF